jgi:hypothetical protein
MLLFYVNLRMLTTEEGGRKNPTIGAGYRPHWVGKNKPEPNDAAVFMDSAELPSGGSKNVILFPFKWEPWTQVMAGDVLDCFEGSKKVGSAVVLHAYEASSWKGADLDFQYRKFMDSRKPEVYQRELPESVRLSEEEVLRRRPPALGFSQEELDEALLEIRAESELIEKTACTCPAYFRVSAGVKRPHHSSCAKMKI